MSIDNTTAAGAAEKRRRGLLAGYMTEDALAQELGKSSRTLKLWRQQRKGPPFTAVGETIIYERNSVRRWLRQQECNPADPQRAA